jgi:hypothetical protein
MGTIMEEWRARKSDEDFELHDRLRIAVLNNRVQLFTDAGVLDRSGSPVHSPWDHLVPLLGLMLLALVILLATGVAGGIVAMTLGALLHLTCNRYLVAWRLKQRTAAFMLESVAHWQAVWQLGGVAAVLAGTNEPACFAPLGDWRKFARRNLRTGEEPPESAQDHAPPPQAAAPPPPPPPPPPVAPPLPPIPRVERPRPVIEPEPEPAPRPGPTIYDA